MSRRPAFSLAYTHETAFASQIAQAFAAPAGIPAQMQAILDQLDRVGTAPRRPLADRLEAIRYLTGAEAADGQGAARSR